MQVSPAGIIAPSVQGGESYGAVNGDQGACCGIVEETLFAVEQGFYLRFIAYANADMLTVGCELGGLCAAHSAEPCQVQGRGFVDIVDMSLPWALQ
ncbi:MAG TPA: hypothetical protein DCP75_04620 [Haliea salexigens]|uniref:Uncharacterized protein n=1 Tax=Haliea salexigens TaxID=287487 RepID=A0A3C1KJX2_9GAMM|nr:hypothetical protein [Haliea salexigens]